MRSFLVLMALISMLAGVLARATVVSGGDPLESGGGAVSPAERILIQAEGDVNAKTEKGSGKARDKTPQSAEKMKKSGDDCAEGVKGAKDQCTEGGSPDLSGIMQALQKAMGDQQGAQSDCSNAAKQQQQNQQPQAPAQQAKKKCEGKQKDCKKKCDQAKQDAEKLKNEGCKDESKKYTDQNEKQQAEDKCKDGADQIKEAGDKGNEACGAPVDGQIAGMAAAIAGFMQGQKKAEQNQAQMCCQDPKYAADNATQCKQVVNCNDITQAQTNPQCICDISARSCKPVTDNGTPPTTDNPASSAGGGGGGGSNLGSSVTDPFQNDSPSSGGSSLPGAGASGSGGGVKGAGIDASKSAGAKINTAVLGGDYGGGAGASHTGSNDEPTGKYGKALPEQLKARALAVEKAQISGSFGPDNWQKIQERYAEFRRNYLGR